jgi:hypothetical protein
MSATKATANQSDDEYQGEPSAEEVEVRAGTSLVPASQYPMASGLAPGSTTGLSEFKMTDTEIAILRAPLKPETEIELRPDGIAYVPGGALRERLIAAFGPGQVALRQERDPFYDAGTQEACFDGSLWIRGKYIARAIGGCKWRPTNQSMSKTDAIEGAKTDCLKRCCKEIGMASDLWNPAFLREFMEEWAVPYQGEAYDWKTKKTLPKTFWRKKGVSLGGQALESATGIGGEYPAGFNKDSIMPDGPQSGQPISEAADALVRTMAEKSSTREWRLTAKAEIVRRANEAREKATAEATKENAPQSADIQLSDVLNGNKEQ